MHPDDTIVAVATAPGPGRRAVVRVSGPGTRGVVGALAADLPAGRALVPGVGLVVPGFASPVPADVYVWAAPRSYTGQDAAELHLISSAPLVEAVVAGLLGAGARAAGPGEFTLRAFLSGKKDLTQAEAVLAVVDAGTDADLFAALDQLAGGVTRPLAVLRDDLLNLLADVEAALDFADEDIEFVSRADTLVRVAAGLAHLKNLARQLSDRGTAGRGVRVTLVGAPNAGKSTLFNALAGRAAALVSPLPGTTRDYLSAGIEVAGIPVELVDTAGLSDPVDAIDGASQALGRSQADRADVSVWCVPLGQLIERGPPPGAAPGRVVRAATLADLRPDAAAPESWVRVSGVTADGLAGLRPILTAAVESAAAPLAPSQARCRAHVAAATDALKRAHEHAREGDPPELLALALRDALHEVGALAGAVHTDDLLDRIFSRFCIGK